MDEERTERVAALMEREGYTALICRLPEHVVMLTGYQPILGTTFCLLSRGLGGALELRLAVPTDEADRVAALDATEVRAFAEETTERIATTTTAARAPLRDLLRAAGCATPGAVVGYESAETPVATAYTQVGAPGASTLALLRDLLPEATLRDATPLLDELAASKTAREVAGIRRAEAVASAGFSAARAAIRPGATEADIAAAIYAALLRAGYALPGAQHVQPHAHVMAGARAALAYRAFNLTSNAALRLGDTVLAQIEIGIDGYWAELTRTFFAGEVSTLWENVYEACLTARRAALSTVRAGVAARQVDAAARQKLVAAGFGDAFRHGLGHGFGFQAINHAAQPILHPASETTLCAGMVHNLEPAVYLDGEGGVRLNENVLVGPNGYELLSAEIPHDLDWLTVVER